MDLLMIDNRRSKYELTDKVLRRDFGWASEDGALKKNIFFERSLHEDHKIYPQTRLKKGILVLLWRQKNKNDWTAMEENEPTSINF